MREAEKSPETMSVLEATSIEDILALEHVQKLNILLNDGRHAHVPKQRHHDRAPDG